MPLGIGSKWNDYSRVILASGVSGAPADATYVVKNTSLEYEMVTQTFLARMIGNQYEGRFAILYDRVLLYKRVKIEKKDSPWDFPINVSARSMRGYLCYSKIRKHPLLS